MCENFPCLRGLTFAFTQRTLWTIRGDSSPFHDTSYMPEIGQAFMATEPRGRRFLTWLGWQASARHESNGKSGPARAHGGRMRPPRRPPSPKGGTARRRPVSALSPVGIGSILGNTVHAWPMNESDRRRNAWICYALSVATVITGVLLSVRTYPGTFDWTYMVISSLASRKANPVGSVWFAGALSLAMGLLWPVANELRRRAAPQTRLSLFSNAALRFGLVFGILVGVDRLAFLHLSDLVRKGHEVLALLAFLGVYAGVLGLYLHRLRGRATPVWPLVLVAVPLVAVGFSELLLYLGQRDVGWLDHDWRRTGIPVWLRFAFWQWLATGALWLGLGHLLLLGGARRGVA